MVNITVIQVTVLLNTTAFAGAAAPTGPGSYGLCELHQILKG